MTRLVAPAWGEEPTGPNRSANPPSSGSEGCEPGWGGKVIEEWGNAHYHQPSDEYSPSWNLDRMIEDTQVGFLAGVSVTQADAMPTWLPGDEFAKVQRAAPATQPK